MITELLIAHHVHLVAVRKGAFLEAYDASLEGWTDLAVALNISVPPSDASSMIGCAMRRCRIPRALCQRCQRCKIVLLYVTPCCGAADSCSCSTDHQKRCAPSLAAR